MRRYREKERGNHSNLALFLREFTTVKLYCRRGEIILSRL
jgi:hypothetical protein